MVSLPSLWKVAHWRKGTSRYYNYYYYCTTFMLHAFHTQYYTEPDGPTQTTDHLFALPQQRLKSNSAVDELDKASDAIKQPIAEIIAGSLESAISCKLEEQILS